jgi:hypothetical protein
MVLIASWIESQSARNRINALNWAVSGALVPTPRARSRGWPQEPWDPLEGANSRLVGLRVLQRCPTFARRQQLGAEHFLGLRDGADEQAFGGLSGRPPSAAGDGSDRKNSDRTRCPGASSSAG